MTERVEVTPDLQRRAAAKAQGVSDRITHALTTLKSATDSRGTPWGNDEYGEGFAKGDGTNGYEAARENLKELTGSLADHSGDHSEGQQRSAGFHADTEHGSADQFR
ncbi:hypothetical protein BJY24_001763 [Nocardia transvalensis]|uniref:Type VII secretion system (Wss) protein ESAT-6 n=1 Tax=Nocardia transvalensis TaxID=37333 RepID=A0A7W9PB72_9NOCA|nr:hypothetical protein [Nocardia transvalensis]MBB5912896.1 hypothetical protein [Nocardia transvalensis]